MYIHMYMYIYIYVWIYGVMPSKQVVTTLNPQLKVGIPVLLPHKLQGFRAEGIPSAQSLEVRIQNVLPHLEQPKSPEVPVYTRNSVC